MEVLSHSRDKAFCLEVLSHGRDKAFGLKSCPWRDKTFLLNLH